MATRVVSGGHEPAAEAPLLLGVQGQPVTGVEVIEGARSGGLLFEFGAARLEILAPAAVWVAGAELAPEHPRFREALLRCLKARVARVAVEAGRELALEFDNGLRIVVSLESGDANGPEAAAFFDEDWNYEAF